MTPEQVRQICDEAGLVLIDRARWERVLLVASHANHHRVEGCCDPSWWPESVTLEPGDLDPVGEVE